MFRRIMVFIASLLLLFSMLPLFSSGVSQAEENETGKFCPDENTGIGTPDGGHDKAPSLYVGGNYFAKENVAELEGITVVEGDFNSSKDGEIDIGEAIGSGVTPAEGDATLMVGGDLNIPKTHFEINEGGLVYYSGHLDGDPKDFIIQKENATADYEDYYDHFIKVSKDYSELNVNGDVEITDDMFTLIGDGHSDLFIFEIDGSDIKSPQKSKALKYDKVPEGATVIINILGDAEININNLLGEDGVPVNDAYGSGDASEFVDRVTHTLWNFVDGRSITVGKSSQFYGSVLVANPDSETKVNTAINGRLYIANDLIHGEEGNGLEIHNYPFIPDFPCEDPDDEDEDDDNDDNDDNNNNNNDDNNNNNNNENNENNNEENNAGQINDNNNDENGETLPKTATNNYNFIVAGIILLAISLFIFFFSRKKGK